jgi:hypothetical protein
MAQKIKINFKKFMSLNACLPLIPKVKRDRLSLACVDFASNMEYGLMKFNKKRTVIFRETASVDGNGNFFLNAKGEPDYNKITNENQAKREALLDSLMNEEIEIEPCVTGDLTRVKDLDIDVIRLYNKFLWDIAPEKIEKMYFNSETKTEENGATA